MTAHLKNDNQNSAYNNKSGVKLTGQGENFVKHAGHNTVVPQPVGQNSLHFNKHYIQSTESLNNVCILHICV